MKPAVIVVVAVLATVATAAAAKRFLPNVHAKVF